MNKKILIIGCGLSSITIGKLFKDNGDYVEIWEKENEIGGLCTDYWHKKSQCYVSKFGPRIMNFSKKTQEALNFIKKFTKLNDYKHRVMCISNNGLTFWPPNNSYNELYKFLEGKNFEKDYVLNYSKKVWGKDMKEVLKNIKNRFKFKDNYNSDFFQNKIQGMPLKGYTNMLKNMIMGIKIIYHREGSVKNINFNNYDYIFSSAPIDSFFKLKFGKLKYVSLKFDLKEIKSETPILSTAVVNMPAHKNIIRVTEYNNFYHNKNKIRIIGKEKVVTNGIPCYPVLTKKNKKLYKKYLDYSKKNFKNLYHIGRLGTCQYINCDDAIQNSINLFKQLKGGKK